MDALADLYRHQEWADAEHWRALEAYPAALADEAITNRLHHIHLVQRAFLWIAGDRHDSFVVTQPKDFPNPASLKADARAYHAQMLGFLKAAAPGRLHERIEIPWFKEPSLELEVQEALLQGAMHSHYHRGQNATRLRELGGEPPPTDLIVWYWRGRPQPSWG
jgi:uncharacterized damage-inducible protein DinB